MTAEALTLRSHATSLPTIFTARPEARTRMRDFFSSHIRNPNTRRAYMEAVRQFSASCAKIGILDPAHAVRGRSILKTRPAPVLQPYEARTPFKERAKLAFLL